MNVVLGRRPATPYARRLARERGLALASITGSGPGGRIVAADVEAFVASPAEELSPSSTPKRGIAASAFAATVDLSNLQKLLLDFGGSQVSVTLDDMILRAAALALEALPTAGLPAQIVIGWETSTARGRHEIILTDPQKGLVSHLHARLLSAEDEARAESAPQAAVMSVRRVAETGIRPASMPLLPGRRMRLVVSAGHTSAMAECLFCFDAQAIDESDAAALLARFRDGIETPLRLLA